MLRHDALRNGAPGARRTQALILRLVIVACFMSVLSMRSTSASDAWIPADSQPVSVLTLEGQVGGFTSRGIRGTFDAPMLDEFLRSAKQDDAQLVIIELNSDGGMIGEATRICDMIQQWREELRIVVYPRKAHCEAAPIALAATELAVWAGSHIGVPESQRTIRFDRDGQPDRPLPELHWKDEARIRINLEAAGRNPDLNVAMYQLDKQLFWCKKHGLRWEPPPGWGDEGKVDPKTGDLIPPPLVDEDERWTMLDGPETLLGLDGRMAHLVGVAQFLAIGVEDLLHQLELPADTPIIRYSEQTEAYVSNLHEQFAAMQRQLRAYEMQLDALARQLVDLAAVVDAEDRGLANNIRRSIGRTRSSLRTAGRAVTQFDGKVLQRRVREPSELLMFIETHAPDLERMGRGSRDTRASLERDAQVVSNLADQLQAILATGDLPPR